MSPSPAMKRKTLIELSIIALFSSTLLAFLIHIDGYELFVDWSRQHEEYEIDEIFMALPVIMIAVSIIGYQRWLDAKRLNIELEASQNFTRNIIRSMADSFIVLNPNLTIKLINKATIRLLGFREEEMIGKPMKMVLAGEELRTNKGLLYRIGKDEFTPSDLIQGVETIYCSKNAELIPVTFTSSIIQDENNRIQGIVCVAKDIREKKKAEAEHKELEEKLHHSQKMEALGTLTEGIAHDFNTLIATIIGYMDVISKDLSPDSSLQSDLTSVSNAANQAKNLVRQLMDFSRPNRQEKEVFNLVTKVLESMEFLKSFLPQQINIETEFNDEEFLVEANEDQLNQLLFNLSFNASNAMTGDDQRLKIQIAKTDSAVKINSIQEESSTESVSLFVTDNGSGMEPEVVDRIFDPYFTTKEFGKGSGLGLSIVHGIVKSHKGEISVESQPGQGTTFQIQLPLFKRN